MAIEWKRGLTDRSLSTRVGLGSWVKLYRQEASGEWEVKVNDSVRLVKTFPELEDAKRAGLGLVARLARETLKELEIAADEADGKGEANAKP